MLFIMKNLALTIECLLFLGNAIGALYILLPLIPQIILLSNILKPSMGYDNLADHLV